jgi:hypothetical protein
VALQQGILEYLHALRYKERRTFSDRATAIGNKVVQLTRHSFPGGTEMFVLRYEMVIDRSRERWALLILAARWIWNTAVAGWRVILPSALLAIKRMLPV